MCSCPLLLQAINTKIDGPTQKRIKTNRKDHDEFFPVSSANISRFQTTWTETHVGKALGTRHRVTVYMFLSAEIETLQDTPDGAVAFFGQSRNWEQLNINTRPPRLSSLLHTTHFPRFTRTPSACSHGFLFSLFPKQQTILFMTQLRSEQRYIKTSYLVLLWAIFSWLVTLQTPNSIMTRSMFGFWCTKNIGWSFHVFEAKAGTQNGPREVIWRLCCVDCAIRHQNPLITCRWADSRGAGYINTISSFSDTPSHLLYLFSKKHPGCFQCVGIYPLSKNSSSSRTCR